MNTQTYTVNIRTGVVNITRVDVSQGDTGRTLAFKLYDGLIPFTPPTGSTVTIVGRKPSKLGFSEACTVSGNVATVATTLAMTQEAGKFPAELRIEADGESIGTANFTMYIEPSPHPDGTTDGTHATADNLQTQIGNLANLTTTAKTNLVSAINEAAQSGGTEVVIDDTLTQTGAAADSKKTGDEIASLKADLAGMNTATSEDVGKALKVKTVESGKVTEWEFGESSSRLSVLSDVQLNTLKDGQILKYNSIAGKWVNAGSDGDTPEDTLLGTLPYEIPSAGCYLLSDTDATITTEGATNLFGLNGDKYVYGGNTITPNIDGTISFTTDADNGNAGYIGLDQLEAGQTYTIFLMSDIAISVARVCSYTGSIPTGGAVVQFALSAGVLGHASFTAPSNRKLSLFISPGKSKSGTLSNLYIVLGEYTTLPAIGGSFNIIGNTAFNTDAFIGVTLSSESTVSVYQTASESTASSGVLFFGDSILKMSNVVSRYSEISGNSVLNCAVGGTRFCGSRDPSNEYYPYDMYSISLAIRNNDFSTQISGGKNSNFSVLASGNISGYKAMVLEFGTNDFTGTETLSGTEVTTLVGGIKAVFENILTAYPSMRIVVLSTLTWANPNPDFARADHVTMAQMRDMIKSCCSEYGISYIDMYAHFGDNIYTRLTVTSDGVHLKEPLGAKRYAEILAGQLASIGI